MPTTRFTINYWLSGSPVLKSTALSENITEAEARTIAANWAADGHCVELWAKQTPGGLALLYDKSPAQA